MCRPTRTLSLFLSLSFLLHIWRTRWVLLPLVLSPFTSVSFSWYLLIKIEFLHISWLKTLFLVMFGKLYIYSNTHPLTWSQVYPTSHKCHINTPFLRVRYQVKQRCKVTRTRSPTRYDFVPTHTKKSPAAQASSSSARLLHSNDCSKPVHIYFLKTLFWTRSQLVFGCSLPNMGVPSDRLPSLRKTHHLRYVRAQNWKLSCKGDGSKPGLYNSLVQKTDLGVRND